MQQETNIEPNALFKNNISEVISNTSVSNELSINETITLNNELTAMNKTQNIFAIITIPIQKNRVIKRNLTRKDIAITFTYWLCFIIIISITPLYSYDEKSVYFGLSDKTEDDNCVKAGYSSFQLVSSIDDPQGTVTINCFNYLNFTCDNLRLTYSHKTTSMIYNGLSNTGVETIEIMNVSNDRSWVFCSAILKVFLVKVGYLDFGGKMYSVNPFNVGGFVTTIESELLVDDFTRNFMKPIMNESFLISKCDDGTIKKLCRNEGGFNVLKYMTYCYSLIKILGSLLKLT